MKTSGAAVNVGKNTRAAQLQLITAERRVVVYIPFFFSRSPADLRRVFEKRIDRLI